MLAVNVYTYIYIHIFYFMLSVQELWTICPRSPRPICCQSHTVCSADGERERRSLYLHPSCKLSQESCQASHCG